MYSNKRLKQASDCEPVSVSAVTGGGTEEERNLVPRDLIRVHLLALTVVYLSIKLKFNSNKIAY